MLSFASLKVWEKPEIKRNLWWYYEVANNRKPAKYLICRRIPAEINPTKADENTLWDVHEKLSKEFQGLFNKIAEDKLSLKELPIAKPNFLDIKVELAKRMLKHCNFCRWNCRVDRTLGTKHGTCQLESESRVSSYFHHRGEELPIRGTGGSGTIFFTSCNMRCAFCQNGDISHDKYNGVIFTPYMVALAMWQLRLEGCHNINLVGGEPTIHLHTIVEAISLLKFFDDRKTLPQIMIAKADGFLPYRMNKGNALYHDEFNTPILWNSNMFMSRETLTILREIVDIWLPDFKFGNNKCAVRLSRTPWYFETVSDNHRTIYEWGENIVIRHLVMPNHIECCTKPVLRWIAENMPGVPVNVMDQYHPDCACNPNDPNYDPRYSDMARYPTRDEVLEAYRYAQELGIPFEEITFERSVYGYNV